VILQQAAAPVDIDELPHLHAVGKRIAAFSKANLLKRKALRLIAEELPFDKIKELEAAFRAIDTDGNGFISMEELNAQCDAMGMEGSVAELLRALDIDGDGKIQYSEFLAATIDKRLYNTEDCLFHAFKVNVVIDTIVTTHVLLCFFGILEI
jgi:calcium-dependent protein kinase